MRFALLFLVAGCRFGFEERPRSETDGAVDGFDGTEAAHCTATKIANYDLGATGMIDVAATQLPDGYAVGTTTADSIVFGVHLDAQLAPNAATAMQTTPASGFAGHYMNGSLYFDGTNLVGGLTVNDGTCFLKVFQPDMMGFVSYVQRTGSVGEPSVSTANKTVAISTWFHDVEIQFVSLMPDGTADTTDRVVTTGQSANVRSVTTASGPSAVVAWDLVNDACGIAAVSDTFGTSVGTLAASACAKPYLHDNQGTVRVVYESGADIVLNDLTVTALPTVTITNTRTLTQGSDPRLFTIAGQDWFAWRDSSRVHVSPVATVTDVPIVNAPSGPPEAYEPAGPYLFGVWGSELWAITCP